MMLPCQICRNRRPYSNAQDSCSEIPDLSCMYLADHEPEHLHLLAVLLLLIVFMFCVTIVAQGKNGRR